jgi:hypothetical protein
VLGPEDFGGAFDDDDAGALVFPVVTAERVRAAWRRRAS